MINFVKNIPSKLVFSGLLVLLITGNLYGRSEPTTTIHWGFLIMGLFGGLSLFLYGMEKMSEGMKKAAGNRMRKIMAALTKNHFIALVVGAFVTMVVQSSSATTVMLVGFVQTGLMTFARSIGIILGANIGTTVTAQLIAFKLTDYALLMIIIGFALTMFARKESYKHLGEALLGFGILFFGMKLMSEAMKPLREYQVFIDVMKSLENPFYGVLIGAAFTALIQSSSAFTGIVIVLAQQGILTLDAGIPMIMGANIGTCVTAGLASIGTAREAKRVALAHVIFNISGSLLFLLWIPYFADLIRSISPLSTGLDPMAQLAADTPRQIANAHTIFNISVGLIFLPFVNKAANLIMRILPEKEEDKRLEPVTWYLDNKSIESPDLAIELARAELARMAKILARMQSAVIHPFLGDESQKDEIFPQLDIIEGIEMREKKIDYLESQVADFLIQISRQEISAELASEVFGYISIVNDMENIGDIISRNISPLMKKKNELKADFSEEGKLELASYHGKVFKQLNRLENVFKNENFKKAGKIMKKEIKYNDQEIGLREKHLQRMQNEKTASIVTHEIHMELMDLMKQINVNAANIAKTLVSIHKSNN